MKLTSATILLLVLGMTRAEDESTATLPLPTNLTSMNDNSTSVTLNEISQSRLLTDEDWNKLVVLLKLNKKKLPQLKKLGSKIDSFIERIDDNQGVITPELFVKEFLADPIPVRDIKVEEDGFLTSYDGEFKNIKLYGVAGVEIESIHTNIAHLHADVKIKVPVVYLTGNYQLKGQFTVAPFEGEGKFRMNITDIDIDASGNMIVNDEVKLEIENIDLDVRPGDMDLQFERLSVLGSEGIGETIIQTMSGILFSAVKDTVIGKTTNKIRMQINDRLAKIPIEKVYKDHASLVFDSVLDAAMKHVTSRLEPLHLPPFEKNTTVKRAFLNLSASIHVYNGTLNGLGSFKRTGPVYLNYTRNHVFFENEMGFMNLSGGYNWQVKVGGFTFSGYSSIQISKISAYLLITQQTKRGAVARLDKFKVTKIDHIWVDMKGLGVWDYMLKLFVNPVANAFRMTISNVVGQRITAIIQEEMDKQQISVIP